MVNIGELKRVLPSFLSEKIEENYDINKLQEIRLVINKPPILNYNNSEIIEGGIIRKDDIDLMMKRISNYSLYAYEEEIKNGYITMPGGHRIGISGEVILENDDIRGIKNVSSLIIRINKEIKGCSKKVLPYICSKERIKNTLIISPPKCGKTTLLRDITRELSNGNSFLRGKKTIVVDERSEIGACLFGVPQLDLGLRTSVIDSCPKSKGIMMAVRTLSPEVVICDEIGLSKDIEAIISALNCGISLITSIHGYGIADYENRMVFKEAIDNKVFDIIIVLSLKNGAGTIEKVVDYKNQKVLYGDKND
ncbi:MAG: stage III sporulation protein AA [Clostridiaceae bacterium]